MTVPGAAAPRPAAAAPSRWPPRWFWCVALALLYVVPYYPRIQSANELPRAYLVKALVDHGTVAIDDGVARWGATADVSPSRGHLYSNKAPGTSLVVAPAYALVKLALGREPGLALTIWLGRVLTGVLPTLALVLLLSSALRRYGVSDPARRLAVLVYAFGSMATPYSVLFIAHQPSAVALAVAWLLAQRVADDPAGEGGRRARRTMLLAGAAAGLAPLLDYQAALALPLLALFFAWRMAHRSDRLALVLSAAAAAAVPLAVLLGYHQLAFGSPWRTGYDASVTFANYHQQGFLGLHGPRWEAFSRSLFGVDTGLLTLTPWLALSVGGLALLWRSGRRAEAALLGGLGALYVLFQSSLSFWRGGWQVGPRYIVVMLPFFVPGLALALDRVAGRRVASVLAAAACLAGVAVFAGTTAQFPYFPERFANPVAEVTLRLWREGQAAPNPLRWLGVPGPWSLLPYLGVIGAPLMVSLRALTGSWGRVLLAAALAAAFVTTGLEHLAGAHTPQEAAYRWIVESMQAGAR
ncbi:MAG: hypothetical protein R3B48_03130 [Kofleriaceae bacterium]